MVNSQSEGVLEEQRKILEGEDLKRLEEMVAKFSTPENPKTEGDYGKHIIINDVGHNIHLERPEALTKPVIAMIEEVRKE